MTKTTLKIDGMMCGMCEAHINDAIRAAFKVKKAMSSHKKGVTEIISETPLDEELVRACIEKTGYKLLSVSTEEYAKRGLFGR
ncbi:MAG: ATPase P [Oscillospiraceae bacterium]|nr:ATPase P [Oscillospiraceae bacterium]